MILFTYRKGSTPLHHLNARWKILFLIILCIITFAGGTCNTLEEVMALPVLIRTAACLLATAALFIISGHNRESLKPMKFVLIIGALMILFRVFNQPIKDALAAGFLYTVRFLITAIAAQIVFETTSSLEIKEAMGKGVLGLTISLAINFIPQVFATWNRVHIATLARTPRYKKGLVRSIHIVYCEIQAFFSCLLYQAEIKRKALLNRSSLQ